MTTLAAVLACVLLAGLAIFQVALIMGAPLGRFAWGGQHQVLPTSLRVGSALSIIIYALLAGIVLARAGLVTTDVPDGVLRATTWVVAGYFLVGVVMNLASRSKAELSVMSPVAAVLCALCVVVATS